jgi:Tol biopolymer transport system component
MFSENQQVAVRRHLRRVLASSEFSRSGRAAAFLEFVVLSTLENNQESLKERAIGIAVFQRPEDWDPKIDTSVRTEARRVRKKLSKYYSSPAADSHDVNIDVPLGSYSPIFRFPEPEAHAELPEQALTGPLASVKEISSGSGRNKSRVTYLRLGLLTVVVGVIAFAALQAFRTHRQGLSNANVGSAFKTLPISDEYGHQLNPAISPDATQIAYASDAGTGTFHIVQRVIDGGAPHRLTSGIDPELSPAYSPDGKTIAFLRLHGTTEVVIRDLASGTEKLAGYIETQLGDWTGDPGPLIGNLGPAWTRDGASLIVSDHPPHSSSSGLFIINLADGSREQLTTTDGSEQDFLPKVSPDGQRIAFIRASTHGHAELFILDLKTRALRQVTNEDRSINGLAWTKDPGELIVSSNREGPYQLWTVNTLTRAFQKIDTDAANAIDPQFPANASWLAYVTLNQEWTIRRLTIIGSPAGQLERFVASVGRNHGARFSPDGRYVAFVSDRSGSWEIWLCGERCSEPQRLTNFNGPWIGGLTWSPDSIHLAFDARLGPKSAIYMMSIVDPKPQLVEKNSFEERMPYWSQDGDVLYFNSDRDGTVAVWKRDLKSRVMTRIGVGFSTREYGPKRKVLLGRSDGLIYEPESMPEAGWKPIRLTTDPVLAWTVHGSSIYYCAIQPDGHVHILAFEDGRSREIADEDISFPRTAASLDVSPDGRYLLLTVSEHSTSNIYRRIAVR